MEVKKSNKLVIDKTKDLEKAKKPINTNLLLLPKISNKEKFNKSNASSYNKSSIIQKQVNNTSKDLKINKNKINDNKSSQSAVKKIIRQHYIATISKYIPFKYLLNFILVSKLFRTAIYNCEEIWINIIVKLLDLNNRLQKAAIKFPLINNIYESSKIKKENSCINKNNIINNNDELFANNSIISENKMITTCSNQELTARETLIEMFKSVSKAHKDLIMQTLKKDFKLVYCGYDYYLYLLKVYTKIGNYTYTIEIDLCEPKITVTHYIKKINARVFNLTLALSQEFGNDECSNLNLNFNKIKRIKVYLKEKENLFKQILVYEEVINKSLVKLIHFDKIKSSISDLFYLNNQKIVILSYRSKYNSTSNIDLSKMLINIPLDSIVNKLINEVYNINEISKAELLPSKNKYIKSLPQVINKDNNINYDNCNLFDSLYDNTLTMSFRNEKIKFLDIIERKVDFRYIDVENLSKSKGININEDSNSIYSKEFFTKKKLISSLFDSKFNMYYFSDAGWVFDSSPFICVSDLFKENVENCCLLDLVFINKDNKVLINKVFPISIENVNSNENKVQYYSSNSEFNKEDETFLFTTIEEDEFKLLLKYVKINEVKKDNFKYSKQYKQIEKGWYGESSKQNKPFNFSKNSTKDYPFLLVEIHLVLSNLLR